MRRETRNNARLSPSGLSLGEDCMSEFITAQDLLAAADSPLPTESLYVPALKKSVWCQGLTATDRSRWERSFVRKNKVDPKLIVQARAALLVLCVIKSPEDRTRLYGEHDKEKLGRVPAVVIEPIYDLCRKLSGIGDDVVEELDSLSAETPTSDSASS
jgi:hypothetical protein